MTAGLGTRLKPFTTVLPKALFPVLGIPLARFVLKELSEAGVTRIVPNVHHQAQLIRSQLPLLVPSSTQLIFSSEEQALLGSAGGIRKALEHLSSPFYLANADVLCDLDWQGLAHHHMRMRDRWNVKLTITVFPSGPPGEAYTEILFDPKTSLLTGLGSKQVGRPFFVGAAVLEKSACDFLPLNHPSQFSDQILRPAIQSGQAAVYLAQGNWFDVGSPHLWHGMHLALLERLETGAFHNEASRNWRRLFEERNIRLAERIYVSRRSPSPSQISKWVGPCYWDAGDDSSILAPPRLGPRSVLYGGGSLG